MSEKRQFIAGATCPECGMLDKLQRVDDGTTVWVACIHCGMQRNLNSPPQSDSITEQPVRMLTPEKRDDN